MVGLDERLEEVRILLSDMWRRLDGLEEKPDDFGLLDETVGEVSLSDGTKRIVDLSPSVETDGEVGMIVEMETQVEELTLKAVK